LLSPANVAAMLENIEDAIAQAVASGALPESRLDAAVAHVLAAKGVRLC
jgi:ribosomal protein S8